MRQCLAGRYSPFWIKMSHGTNKTFKIIVNPLPKGEWFARVFFIEAIPYYLENAHPGTIAKLPQKRIQPVFIREVGDLALNYNGQRIHTFIQLLVSNRKNTLYGK